MQNALNREGRIWIRGALDDITLTELDALLDLDGRPGARIADGSAGHILGADGQVGQAVQQIYPQAFPVRVVAFNKSETGNWAVPWHQDRVIAVQERHDVKGYFNWSKKTGIWHCEPPIEVLDRMLFVRVHLDNAGSDDGAMEIVPKSHHQGIIAASEAARFASENQTEICANQRGDILIMNMLMLHRSRPSKSKNARRVLRVDYATGPMQYPLQWAGL